LLLDNHFIMTQINAINPEIRIYKRVEDNESNNQMSGDK